MTRPSIATLREWDRSHYWHSFTPMADYEPLIIERGEGCTLYDIRGNAYLDAASSMWCAALGHNHPRLNAAISAQLGRLAHCTSLGMGAEVTVRLAKRLADLAPGELSHVFFSSDGSSAVEVAMKQALQYWCQSDTPQPERVKYLSFGQAYHGDTIGATAVGGIGRFNDLYAPLLCEVVRVEPPDSRQVGSEPSDAQRCVDAALQRVERVLEEQASQIVAVIIEPLVQMAAGMLMHPPGFLRGVRRLCDKYNVLLIADEIAVGLGRTGRLFACDHEGVTPDFLCLGKHLTAGYLPLAATITTPRIFQAFLNRTPAEDRTFWHGHTYSGNALASAAALATLEEFEAHVLAALPAKIEQIAQRLSALADHPLVTHIRQRGMIGAFSLGASASVGTDGSTGKTENADQAPGRRLARYALEQGVWLRAKPDLIYVTPPLTISADQIDRLFDVIAAGLEFASAG
ncbi:adenosylmethionine--8-amino-7-oxononanoate transaminase [Botrimarina hoheduenensis]|uniref:Adenosylmethionine-8-amino-7-oxononanoate aminotransferase n=1 Tax=Botrimarina hoheduenensis TaxID=2528000 RepID=A0A5C5VZL5_9BACT|nr:adenosylmethionine--8-amino-7-oxononanoate transaminase [Botrimarina hoheduenensis]TWT42922.1 Adenosylmethionine-8-amino-7-oxononanoate aminotransferase [Botrimarina hoheduenensis]